MENIQNVIVIGGGPAGMAASIYNARAGLKPLVFGGSPYGGQLMLTSDVENYPGFESILGPEFIEKLRQHTKKFGTTILDENVESVDFTKRPFEVTSAASKKVFKAKSVIIATGAKALWLGLESETRLRGKGVSACATCDGFFFKEKVVTVVGGGDTALEEALFLTKFASKIYLIHRRDSFRASKIMQERVKTNEKIEILWNSAIEEIVGENKVESINLRTKSENGKTTTKSVKIDGVFIAIGHKPDTEIFKNKIELDEKDYVRIFKKDNLTTLTSVEGVFAAGDNVDHIYRQAATAVGMGVAAAIDAERWLEST